MNAMRQATGRCARHRLLPPSASQSVGATSATREEPSCHRWLEGRSGVVRERGETAFQFNDARTHSTACGCSFLARAFTQRARGEFLCMPRRSRLPRVPRKAAATAAPAPLLRAATAFLAQLPPPSTAALPTPPRDTFPVQLRQWPNLGTRCHVPPLGPLRDVVLFISTRERQVVMCRSRPPTRAASRNARRVSDD